MSADVTHKSQAVRTSRRMNASSGYSHDKLRAPMPGAVFFAIPAALILTVWAVIKMDLSLWFAVPIYSFFGASIIMFFAAMTKR